MKGTEMLKAASKKLKIYQMKITLFIKAILKEII